MGRSVERAIAAYLDAASEDGDPQLIAVAIGDIVRARNVSKIARDTGLTREGIYKALSPGKALTGRRRSAS